MLHGTEQQGVCGIIDGGNVSATAWEGQSKKIPQLFGCGVPHFCISKLMYLLLGQTGTRDSTGHPQVIHSPG